MKPILKKVLAAVAIKEGVEKVVEMRKPKRSAWSRVTPLLVIVGLGGALAFLAKTGKLQPAMEKAKSLTGNGESRSEGTTESQRQPVNV